MVDLVKYDFLAIGSSVIDIHARINDIEKVEIRAPSIERLVAISFASKTELEDLDTAVGGSALNSSFTMAHLGSKVALLSAVGNDIFGRKILAEISKEKVASEFIRVKNGKTGIGIDLLSGDGEKSVLVYRGVLKELSPEDLPEKAVMQAKHIFLTSLVSEKSYALFLKAVRLAKKHRRQIVFAPSISMLHAFGDRLKKVHQHFDMVIMNYEEASLYTGKKTIRSMLTAMPGRICVITKDIDGAYAREGKKFYHVHSVPVKIKGTIGAGDAFSGAFASEYYRTKSIKEALKTAASIAALKLQHVAAVFHPRINELADFMKKNCCKLRVQEIGGKDA
ncbi:MAG: carbohydrate kinase family protein [Candidatus Woesearchaeota archaeon]